MANEFVEPSVYRYNYGKFEEMDVLITLTSIPLEELEYIKNLFSKLEIIKFDKNGFNVRRYWNKHNDRDRTSKSYKEWRDSIFKRDNYTCQSCKKRGVNLEAHHIKPWSKFKELRFDNDNGITLCTKCHKDLHKNKRC
jgi:predicted methyltransferase